MGKDMFRDAGVKAAKTTMLELNVLLHLEDVYTELREQIIVRRAEMVGKLKDMGYGGSIYLKGLLVLSTYTHALPHT